MTYEEYIKNPSGKGSSAAGQRDGLNEDYENKNLPSFIYIKQRMMRIISFI